MKKIILGLALLTATMVADAQSFRIGLAGGYNSTWLFDKTTSDAGDDLDYKSSFGGQIGVEALYNFRENAGVSIGILSNSINQKYTNRNPDFESEFKVKYISIPVLFRYTSEKGPYFEVGPEFSFGGKVKYEVDGTEYENFTDADGNTLDDSDIINTSNTAIAIGFGVDVKASENIAIIIGLRFAWGVSDVTKPQDKGQDGYEPTNTAVGGLHLGVSYVFPSK